MASKTSICNLALRHLGHSKAIANVETERSKEALACRTFYDQVLEEVFRDFAWPFALRTADLQLVEEDPNDEWSFSYRYPTSSAFFRRILSGQRIDTNESKVPYQIGKDDDGRLIYTDMEEAQGQWTDNTFDDPEQWPADFIQSVALLLAFYIAPSVTAGDEFKLGARAGSLYNWRVSKASANSKNEEEPDQQPDAAIIRARE